MKKTIAISVGLLLIGSVGVASAEVIFTGDARERMVLSRSGNLGLGDYTSNDDHNAGRVRFAFLANTPGGAYVTARVRLSDGRFDGVAMDGRTNQSGFQGIYTDYAYLGIPMGPVTLNAGVMPDLSSLFFRFDKRYDRVMVTYANKMTSASLFFDKFYDQNAGTNTASSSSMYSTSKGTLKNGDEDVNEYGVIVKQKFAADWNALGYFLYQDNQRDKLTFPTGATNPYRATADTKAFKPSGSGFAGTIDVNGPVGPVKMAGDVAYVSKNLMGDGPNAFSGDNGNTANFNLTPNMSGGTNLLAAGNGGSSINANGNQYGSMVISKHGQKAEYADGYGFNWSGKMTFGPASGTLVLGYVGGGYETDYNFGFIMIGGAMGGVNGSLPTVGSPISAISRIGQAGPNVKLNSAAKVGGVVNPSDFAANTFYTGIIGDYQINKMIKLVGIVGYANAADCYSALELSGLVNFAITDSSYINVGAGVLGVSVNKTTLTNLGVAAKDQDTQSPVGAFTEFGVKF